MATNADGTAIPDGGSPSGAGGSNTNTDGNNAPGGGQKPVADPTGGNNQPKVFTYPEDRTDWVPRTRLNENNPKFTQRLTQAETERETLKAELEAERKRTRALAGLENPSAEEAQEKEVRTLITKMFPQLESFADLTKEQLQTVLNAGNAANEAAVRNWERHSETMISSIEDSVAKAIGVDKLTERQSRQLRRAYVDEAQTAVNARQQGVDFGNDFMSRHEKGDKTLVSEFAKAIVDDWFEPARRVATSQAQRRIGRPVPSGARAGTPVSKTPEINYNDEKSFKDALIAARRGGE